MSNFKTCWTSIYNISNGFQHIALIVNTLFFFFTNKKIQLFIIQITARKKIKWFKLCLLTWEMKFRKKLQVGSMNKLRGNPCQKVRMMSFWWIIKNKLVGRWPVLCTAVRYYGTTTCPRQLRQTNPWAPQFFNHAHSTPFHSRATIVGCWNRPHRFYVKINPNLVVYFLWYFFFIEIYFIESSRNLTSIHILLYKFNIRFSPIF